MRKWQRIRLAGVERLMGEKGWRLVTNYGGETALQLVAQDGRNWDFKISGGSAWIAKKEA